MRLMGNWKCNDGQNTTLLAKIYRSKRNFQVRETETRNLELDKDAKG